MHFAFVLYRYFPHGGLQKDFVAMAKEVAGRSHQITLIVSEIDEPLPGIAGSTVVQLPAKGISNHARIADFAKQVQKFLRQAVFDAVVMFSRIPGGDFYYAADDCFAAQAQAEHPFLSRILPRYRTFGKLEKAVFAPQSNCRIFTLTDRQIMQYRKYYHTPEDRFIQLPPGIAGRFCTPDNTEVVRNEVRQEFNIPDDAILILQIASSFKTKGVDRAIAAVASLDKKQNVYFLVCGGDNSVKYRKLAAGLDISDRVIFTGARNDVERLLAASDVMLHPARKEATGTVIIEALAMDIPVIATDVCGYACYVREIDPGLVVPSDFEQKKLNNILQYALSDLSKFRFGGNKDFYRRAEVFADMLEKDTGKNAKL